MNDRKRTPEEEAQSNPGQPGQDRGLSPTAQGLQDQFTLSQQEREQVEQAQPKAWEMNRLQDWRAQRKQAQEGSTQSADQIKQWAEQQSPEEIQKLQSSIADQHQAGVDAHRESQGLPKQDNVQSMEQKIDQSNEAYQSGAVVSADRIKQGRQGQGQSQGQEQDQKQGQKGQGGPTSYAEYAAGSKEEAEDMKQLEERQNKFVQENGRWPRGGEIEKIEAAEREQEEQKRKRTQ